MDAERTWVQDKDGVLVRSALPLEPDRINLVFDFDGVITQPQELKSVILGEKGYTIAPEQTDKQVAQELMLQQNPSRGKRGVSIDYLDMINQLYVHRMLDVPPEKDAIDVLKKLEDNARYASYIVTSRRSSVEDPEIQAAGKWLHHYGLQFDGIINTNNQSKKEDLKELRPLIFVDDSISKIYELFEDPQCTVLDPELSHTYFALFRQRANHHAQQKGLIKTIQGGWIGLEQKIHELSN